MVDYTKMKNADLESLLKERGLPHTGKKADMVSRLTEDDDKKASVPGAIQNEDEIDWDDDAAEAPAPIDSAPAAAAVKTNVDGNNPQAVPNQAASIDPSTTEDLATSAPTAETASTTVKASENGSAPPEKVDFSMGLSQTDVEKEIEAREKRKKRFEIADGNEDPAAVEALQKLQRAKKFSQEGAGEATAVKGLDMALPDRPIKRRRDERDDRGDYKRGGRGGRRFNERRGFRDNGRRGPRDDRGSREPRQERNGGQWMNEADRRKAAERASRFAAQD